VPNPKRLVFLSFGWGVTRETWFPDVREKGAQWKLPPGLEPLAKHQSDLTVVQGLCNQFTNDAHWGSTFWLTGANRYALPGQSFHNSVSADQVAAEVIGKNSRFASLQLSCENAQESGHGPGLSLAWDARGKPLPGLQDPVATFHRLFSNDTTPLAQRQALLKQKRSVLDTLLEDAKTVSRSLIHSDREKLEEYLQSVRDIETRLSNESRWLDKPKPRPADIGALSETRGLEEIKLMYRLLVAALQTDSTRVITYRQPVESLLQSLGIGFTGHNVSHYAPGPRQEASELRDKTQSQLLSGLLDQLKAARQPDGSSLFDHTTVVYGSNIQSAHFLENCPTLVAGRGAGVRLGQHLVFPSKTPLCNLWLTLLKGSGIPAEKHGDSTICLSALLA
jgi:hypothetical protein